MRPAQKTLIGVAVLVMVIAIGVIIGLMSGGGPPPLEPVAPVVPIVSRPQPTPPSDPMPAPVTTTPRPPETPVRPPALTQPTPLSTPSPAVPGGTIVTNWEDKLNEVLAGEDDDTNKAKVLLEMFPQLPEDGQVEVAEHLLNLLAGQDYTPLAQMLKDPKLAEAVQEVILSDALNWPNTTKLPLLLDVAQNSEHPKASEAKDWLELYIGEDYGTNWGQWRAKAQDYIKENPEE